MTRSVAAAWCLVLGLPAVAGALEIPVRDFGVKTCGADQGGVWNLWSDGFAAEWLRFPADGEYAIEVEAAGQVAKGEWPRMRVSLDLEPCGEVTVYGPKVGTHRFAPKVSAGVHRLSLAFLNDYYDPARGEDRNLLLRCVRVRPAAEGAPDVSRASAPDVRKETEESIVRVRTGDLLVEAKGPDGKPLAGARVRAVLVRHAFRFGCAITSALADPGWQGPDRESFERLFAELFNFAVHENALKWMAVNRAGPPSDFGPADRILDWCRERGIGMRGHCILWDDEKWIPGWARELPDEEFRKAVLMRIREVAERYEGEIREYDLNNEMIHLGYLGRRFGKEFYAELFRTAKEADAGARFFVNDFNILTGVDLEAYARHTEGLIRAGAPVGGIGCQGHFGRAPDPLTVRMGLDRLAKLGLPIEVTEFDVDTPDEKAQASDLESFYRTCFAHPSVSAILMWGFWEGAHWRPRGALYARDWREKPAAKAYRRLVLGEWRTDLSGTTDADGRFGGRAFFGTYRIRVEPAGGSPFAREIVFGADAAGHPIEVRTP